MVRSKVRCRIRIGLIKPVGRRSGRDSDLLEAVEDYQTVHPHLAAQLEGVMTNSFLGVECGWVRATVQYDYAVNDEKEWKKLRKGLLRSGWTPVE